MLILALTLFCQKHGFWHVVADQFVCVFIRWTKSWVTGTEISGSIVIAKASCCRVIPMITVK